MEKLTIPRNLKNFTNSLNPELCKTLVVVARHYDSDFIKQYRYVLNNNGFAKSSKKAVSLISTVYVFNKLDRPIIDFFNESVERYEPIFCCQGLENAFCAIPEGFYELEYSYSPKFKRPLPGICDVPKRDGIRIHTGNYAEDTIGCLLLGLRTTCGILEKSTEAFTSFMSKMNFEAPNRTCICFCDYNTISKH